MKKSMVGNKDCEYKGGMKSLDINLLRLKYSGNDLRRSIFRKIVVLWEKTC